MKAIFWPLIVIFLCPNDITTQTNKEKKKIRILFWVNNFPTNTGGSTLNQVIGFTKENHDVAILTQNLNDSSINMSHPEILQYDLISKVHVKTLPKNKKVFDIIFCQSASLALPLLEFKKRNNITGKMVVFVRGADLKKFNDPKTCERIFKSFDMIAPVCDYFKMKLSKLYPDIRKVRVFHSSINCEKFAYKRRTFPKNGKILIATTSRLAKKKGLDIAIKAISLLAKKYKNFHYLIIGDGSLKEQLQSQIDKLGIEKHVSLLGWKTPEEVIEILKKVHIFILPSVTRNAQEGIPNALKEAMAMGIPVVSTYHAGIPELVENGKSGFLVPENDDISLAKKIIFLIEHPETWNKMGKAGRKFVTKNFDRENENKKLIKACKKLCF